MPTRALLLLPRLVLPALAVCALSLAINAPPLVFAQGNLVRIDPSGVEVAPGGSFTIAVVDEPSPESTAVWAIDVSFDPNVVTVRDPDHDCDSLDSPPGSTSAAICQGADSNNDGRTDTMKVIGAVIFNGTGKGLTEVTTLATIIFAAVGGPGECSDLRLRIRSHADSDGKETGAQVQDGRACIEGDAPPAGTASPIPVTPRTSEPTESPTPRPGSTSPGSQSSGAHSPGPGQTDSSGVGGGSGVGTDGPEAGNITGAGSPGSDGSASASGRDDGGGTSTWVWIGAVAAALAFVAGGTAWWIIRIRGAKSPPEV